jgi:chitinase
MRFSNAAALFSLASIAQAAPAVESREVDVSSRANWGTKYQAGVFYVNWVSSSRVLLWLS